jgi:hypothetical protein
MAGYLLDVIISPVYRLPLLFIVAKLAMDCLLVRYLYDFKNKTVDCALCFDIISAFDIRVVSGLLGGFWNRVFGYPIEMFGGPVFASLLFLVFELFIAAKFFVQNRYLRLCCIVLALLIPPSIVLTLLIPTKLVPTLFTYPAEAIVVCSWLLQATAQSLHIVFFSCHLLLKLTQRREIERKKRQIDDNS